ncbi:MAG: glycosyltransferase family 39 protein, partial [bacterium]
MAITSRKVAGLAVAAFALVGLVLRLWQHNAVFPEADEAIWAGLPLKLHTHPFFLPGGLRDNPLAQLAAWQYGYLYPCVLLLWVKFLSLAGLCVNEVVMILPCIAIGTASIALAYYVAREFFGYRAGLLCAAFTAVLPLHVGLSRTMITTRIPASFLQMLTILLFVRLMKGGSKKSAWLAGFALAAYCVSNPMFPGTLAVLLLIAFLYAGDNSGTLPERIRETFRRVFRKELVLPPLLALL